MLKVRRFWKKYILDGRKTQTRRPWRRAPKVGSVHDCRPKRNVPGFAWVKITRVWKQRLGDVSEAEARAEGFPSRRAMLEHFCLTYAKRRALGKSREWWENVLADVQGGRARGPEVWAIEFRRVKSPGAKQPPY